jgi:hypothetical protein
MTTRLLSTSLLLTALTLGCESQNRDRHSDRNDDDARMTRVTRTTEVRQSRARDSIPGNESVRRTAVEARMPDPMTLAQRQAALEQLATAITTAQTRDAQANALRRLWQHMRDHNYTYQTSATRLSNNQRVDDPAAAPFPVRMNITIFQADRRLYDFSFNPIDNRDITFLTTGGT